MSVLSAEVTSGPVTYSCGVVRSFKFQRPSSRETSNIKLQKPTVTSGFEIWSWGFLWRLEVGGWRFPVNVQVTASLRRRTPQIAATPSERADGNFFLRRDGTCPRGCVLWRGGCDGVFGGGFFQCGR